MGSAVNVVKMGSPDAVVPPPPHGPSPHGARDLWPLPRSPLGPVSRTPGTPGKTKRSSTFQEFESDTSDAWDAGDDDDELLAMAAQGLHTAVVMETAQRVLHHHSQQQRQGPSPAEPAGDPRLVKSVSESHTACPAGGATPARPHPCT